MSWSTLVEAAASFAATNVALAVIFSAPGKPLPRRSAQPRVDGLSDADVLLQSGASLSNMR